MRLVRHMVNVQALGAAKNHGLVMPDVDIEATANALLVRHSVQLVNAVWHYL